MSIGTPIIPALCSVTFRSLSPEELVPLARQNGVQAIEWGADVHVPLGDLTRARQVSELCRQQDIAAASYGSYVRAGDTTCREEFSQAVDTAQALGAANIRVWAGRNTPEHYSDSERRELIEDLVHMAGAAAAKAITVSIEYHRNTLTEKVQDAVDLLQQANHGNLFSYWQPVPGRSAQERLAEMTALAPWLGHLHVFHWIPADDGDERRPLAEGLPLWTPVLRQWHTAPHWSQPRLAMLEFVANDDPDQFRLDMQALHECIRLAEPDTHHCTEKESTS